MIQIFIPNQFIESILHFLIFILKRTKSVLNSIKGSYPHFSFLSIHFYFLLLPSFKKVTDENRVKQLHIKSDVWHNKRPAQAE